MTEVRWEDLEKSPTTYEDMVAVLLSRLHPNAERIDGIGGDGGRDVQLREGGRLDIFELKSFTGRISARSPNRRRQVEASLSRAAEHNPDSWTLIVPIDHNDNELAWFDELRSRYRFALTWRGRTWLNNKMSTFRDIRRYFLDGLNDEVVSLMRELNADKALTGGAIDAVDRLDAIRARLNDIDPYFGFELTTGTATDAATRLPNAILHSERLGASGPVTISVLPKYRDSLKQRPMAITTTLEFPNDPIGQEAALAFQGALEFGDPVVVASEYVPNIRIDAPGGLGGDLGPGTLSLGPPAENNQFLLEARLRITAESESPVASIPITLNRRQHGTRGGTLFGQDATGIINVAAKYDMQEGRGGLTINVKAAAGFVPATLLTPLRFIHALRPPNLISLEIGGAKLWAPRGIPSLDLVSSEYVHFIEQVARVQAETNTSFALPPVLGLEDFTNLRRIVSLLDGASLPLQSNPVVFTLSPRAPDSLLDDLRQGGFFRIEAQMSQPLMGEDIPLGICNIVMRGDRFDVRLLDQTDPSSRKVEIIPPEDAMAFLKRGPMGARTEE